MDSPNAMFPLENISDYDLQKVCQKLWQWNWCSDCTSGHTCPSTICPWKRWKRLTPFFQFYKACTTSYIPELLIGSSPALRQHSDLLNIITLLQSSRESPRETLIKQFLINREASRPEESDANRAFNLAVKIMTMVACTGENQPADLFDAGSELAEWRNGETLSQFIESAFPMRDHPTLNEKDDSGIDIKSNINAVQLQKIAGLKFQGTDNLMDHLRMNRETGAVQLFHHTSILKEALNTKHPNYSLSCSRPPGMISGIIPRQLALETLDSLQKILFPMDRESRRLLRSLVSKQDLDPDCLRFDTTLDRTDDEIDIKYQYWGSRLMDLYDEVENPKPRGYLEQWMERKSGARYVMMATLAGVMIAVILGLLGLAVSIFQAWVGYQQWKHPVTDG